MAAPMKAKGRDARSRIPVFTDGVILIRPMIPEDVDAHLAGEDRERLRWLSGFPSSRENVLAWIRRNAECWKNDGPVFNFGVVELENDRLVGMVEANTDARRMDGVSPGEANISYDIYPFARGHHYATRAVSLMLSFLAERDLVPVIRASPMNGPSIGVAKSSGFRRTGVVLSREPNGLIELEVYHHELE